jgi:hypothetical protein
MSDSLFLGHGVRLDGGTLRLETREPKTGVVALRFICDMTELIPEIQWATAAIYYQGKVIYLASRETVEAFRPGRF